MNKSESIAELASALSKAQGEIEGASKDKINGGFKTKYADLSSVTEAIKPHLSKHGLSYVQISHDMEHGVGIETVIMHSSGEWLSCGILNVPVTKNDAQGYGSACTYARRYSLSAAFGVCPEDDDGNAAAKAAPRQEPAHFHQDTDAQLSEWEAKIRGAITVELCRERMTAARRFAASIGRHEWDSKFMTAGKETAKKLGAVTEEKVAA